MGSVGSVWLVGRLAGVWLGYHVASCRVASLGSFLRAGGLDGFSLDFALLSLFAVFFLSPTNRPGLI